MSPQSDEPPGPLPRGRHRLSRDEVRSSQHHRLCTAALVAVGELGYAATTVADIVSRAQVARRTFYALFSGKDECFAAAYDFGVETGLRALREVVAAAGEMSFAERVQLAFDVYLTTLAAEPAAARALYVETLVAGGPLVAHRARVHRLFAEFMLDIARCGVDGGDLLSTPDPQLIDMLLGGIDDRIRACLHERGAEHLPDLSALFTRTALALCDRAHDRVITRPGERAAVADPQAPGKPPERSAGDPERSR
ncbi:TetR/AcrR family transcriptional regulator [Nocardia sp. alder85J]|uniref:TetR/AcrR family transcriptional regulator n=1 Tax=Nocardia sp. alder85J TaxID=2862949 RepID=UPI001CD333F0|nr:TetR/AcrR family transcriptional regulator [Nocardia sp. alder85J]MCX4096151.1 helix-turn-helix domain containing protein [Nocardia sp. alder85J]